MIGLALQGGGARGAYQAGACIALKKAGIKLIVSTHSYSLCNLLNVSINNIIFINKSFDIKKSSYKNSMIKLTLNDVKKIYNESTIDFESFIKDKKLDVDGGIRNKMHFRGVFSPVYFA